MKSTIRIEFDFDTNQPVLRIKGDFESDDLRDQMLKNFLEKCSSGGTVMYISYPSVNGSIVDIRCEKQVETRNPFILTGECRSLANTYAKSEDEEKAISNFFSGLDTKISLAIGNLKE